MVARRRCRDHLFVTFSFVFPFYSGALRLNWLTVYLLPGTEAASATNSVRTRERVHWLLLLTEENRRNYDGEFFVSVRPQRGGAVARPFRPGSAFLFFPSSSLLLIIVRFQWVS